MKNLLIIAILFYHIFNMQAFSAVNWGEATVKGEILASGCSMQLTSKNQIIEFGDYPLSRAEEKKSPNLLI